MEMTKKRIIYTIAVAFIVVFSTTFAILMTLERMDYRNYLQGEYSKNMYELITSVDNIRVNLGKAAVSGSKEQSNIIFEEIFRHSAIANDKLHSLPVAQEQLGESSKFLTQVGDFCYTLVKASSEGRELTEEEFASIDRLKDQSFGLQRQLNTVLSDINEGKVKWGEIRKKASGVFAKSNEALLSDQFKGIQKQVAQYPSLIYDGPFSDNILDIKPKIEAQKEVSEKEAEEIIKNVIGKDRIEKIELNSVKGKTRIEAYRFYIQIKGRDPKVGKTVCEVSKKGGKVIYLLDNKKVSNSTMDNNKAISIGEKYLDKIGFHNMSSTYVLKYDNTLLVSYVYKKGNIIMYPDQVKLKIALDNGEIVGIESEKYLVAHEENRNKLIPKVTKEEASKKVSKRLKITTTRLAIIPTETNKEVLCYEFVGTYKEDSFIVYINAQTGVEQRIIQIINTPNGQLTM